MGERGVVIAACAFIVAAGAAGEAASRPAAPRAPLAPLASPGGGESRRGESWSVYKRWLCRELRTRDCLRHERAVRGLARYDNAESARIAVEILRHRNPGVTGAAERVISGFTSTAALDALAAEFTRPRAEPVRPRMLRAFGRMRDRQTASLILRCVRAFRGGDKLVAAIDAAGERNLTGALGTLVKLAGRYHLFPVRVSAVRALARIPNEMQIPHLIALLDPPGGRIRQEAAVALRTLTGRDLGADRDRWREWWTASRRTFRVSPGAARRRNFTNSELGARADATYYGVPVHARRVVFVLDRSGSMRLGRPESRLDGVKRELVRLIGGLGDDVEFNVIFFSTGVTKLKAHGLRRSSKASRAAAARFIERIRPGRQTDTPAAMKEALRLARESGVETIFLLTDGAPYRDGWLDMDDVCDDISRRNGFLKVRINTVGIFKGAGGLRSREAGEPPELDLRGFLRRIARENDGRFVGL